MSRVISMTAMASMFAEESGDYPIILLTIDHDDMDDPILISSDPTERVLEDDEQILYGTVSRGDTYYFAPFSITLPTMTSDGPPTAQITIDNVNRSLIPTIRELLTSPTISMELVWSFDTDTVDIDYAAFTLSEIDYDDLTITATLNVPHFEDEPYPYGTFTPGQFPGVFS